MLSPVACHPPLCGSSSRTPCRPVSSPTPDVAPCSGDGGRRQSAAEHRKAVIDRLYSGDAAQRHLQTLSLLDPEVRPRALRPAGYQTERGRPLHSDRGSGITAKQSAAGVGPDRVPALMLCDVVQGCLRQGSSLRSLPLLSYMLIAEDASQCRRCYVAIKHLS